MLEKTTLIDNAVDKNGINKHFVLNYYVDDKVNKLKGSYVINEETQIETAAEFDGKANVLTVTSLKSSGEVESMHLSLATEEERLQWFNALKEVTELEKLQIQCNVFKCIHFTGNARRISFNSYARIIICKLLSNTYSSCEIQAQRREFYERYCC